MRIAIVFPHLASNTEERNTYNISIRERFLSKRLNESGHESFLCYLTHETDSFKLGKGASAAHFYPIDDMSRTKSKRFYTSMLLGQALAEFNPEIVVFKGMGYILPWWLYHNNYFSGKIIFIVGGNPKDILLPATTYVFSEYVSQLKRIYAGFTKTGRAMLLGKYIPDLDFGNTGKKEFDIVSVGAISRRKNHRALVPFFKQYKVVIVGEGPELEKIKEAASGNSNVVFTGAVLKEQVAEYIQRARIMVHPSKNEGFPRVFAESFAAGVPVVALKRAIKGDFPGNVAGLLVKEQELEKEVTELLKDKKRIREYSQNAFHIAESYRGENIFRQFLKGIEIAEKQKPITSLRFFFLSKFLLPLRYLFWFLDHHFYNYARRIKRKMFLFLFGQE